MTVKRVLLILVLFLTSCAKEEGYRIVLMDGGVMLPDVYSDKKVCVAALQDAAVVAVGRRKMITMMRTSISAYGIGYCIATSGQETYGGIFGNSR